MDKLIFIPPNDLSDLASDAETFDELDFGIVFADQPWSLSFRLGNPNDVAIDYLWWVINGNSDPRFSATQIDLPEDGSLGPNQTTDTLSVSA